MDPARAAELRAEYCRATAKTIGTAERAYKQAIAVSSHPAYEWATLSRYYARTITLDGYGCSDSRLRQQRWIGTLALGVALYDQPAC